MARFDKYASGTRGKRTDTVEDDTNRTDKNLTNDNIYDNETK
jgi:hypothetical protein